MSKINSCKNCEHYYREKIRVEAISGDVSDDIVGNCELYPQIISDADIHKIYALCEINKLTNEERIDIYAHNMFENSIDETMKEIEAYLWFRSRDILHDAPHKRTYDLFRNMDDVKLYMFNKYFDMFLEKFNKDEIIKNASKR